MTADNSDHSLEHMGTLINGAPPWWWWLLLLSLLEKKCSNCVWNSLVCSYLGSMSGVICVVGPFVSLELGAFIVNEVSARHQGLQYPMRTEKFSMAGALLPYCATCIWALPRYPSWLERAGWCVSTCAVGLRLSLLHRQASAPGEWKSQYNVCIVWFYWSNTGELLLSWCFVTSKSTVMYSRLRITDVPLCPCAALFCYFFFWFIRPKMT